MFFDDFNLHKKDIKYVMAILILSILCFIKLTEFARSGGILHPDSALYLLNSLVYADMDYYNIVRVNNLYYSPIISFLTSLLFRWGIFDKIAIVMVSMGISFTGYIGLYILFKNRFNSLLSFLGVVIFGCSSIVIYNLPQGLLDIPSVAISIWVLVFAVAAIDKHPKYFLLAFPLFVVGFFTKYTVGFMLPIIFLYYVMNRNFIDNVDCLFSNPGEVKQKIIGYVKSKEFKYILLAIVISFILGVIICKTLILDYGGSFSFLTQSLNTFNGHEYSSKSPIYYPQKSHYIREFTTTFSQNREFGTEFMYVLYAIFAVGVVAYAANAIKNFKFIASDRKSFNTKYFAILVFILFIGFSALSVYAFKFMSNSMISNVSFLIAVTLFYAFIQKFNIHEKNVSFDLMMASYFVVYMIFLSIYALKLRRYSMPFVPPFVYMIIWGFNSVMKLINDGFDSAESFKESLLHTDNEKHFSMKANVLPIVFIVVLLVSTTVFLAPQEITDDNEYFTVIHDKGFVNDLMKVCEFIKENDTNYHNKSYSTFSHSQRIVKWYVQAPRVITLPDNSTEIVDYDKTTYVILNRTQDFNNYHEIYRSGVYTAYRHN